MTKLEPRKLDHVVLPVPDLDVARERLSALGFTVAEDGRHKFGTENCCVHFANGTFLEPLAIGHRETVEANMLKGNNFLIRDATYRFRNGDNGFSMVVFIGENARAERKMLRQEGYRTGKMVTVKRPGVYARSVFSIDERAPDFSCFLCQWLEKDLKNQTKLVGHENGAMGISRVVLCEIVPSDFQYYLQIVSGQRDVQSHSFGMDQNLPNAVLSVLTPVGMKSFYGVDDATDERGLKAKAIDIEVNNLKTVEKLLKNNKVGHLQIGVRLVVPPALGQGFTIAFMEK